jgi:hypothetical protein
MFLLQMNFQELEGFKAVLPDLVTIFEMARECRRAKIRGFGPSVVFNVMVVANMLTEVILALETVVASISMRLSKLARLYFQIYETVAFTIENSLEKERLLRTYFRQ